MRSNFTIITLLLFLSIAISAQDKNALHYASLIDSTNLKLTLTRLASDEFEGRGTGERGEELTIAYLSEYLKGKNIAPANKGSYFQNIEAVIRDKGGKRFDLSNFNYVEDYSYENSSKLDSIVSTDNVIFVGYGVYSSTYNDFANVDITDKVLMMIEDMPSNKYGLNYAVNGLTDEYLKQKHPKAVIKVQTGFRSFSNYAYRQVLFPSEYKESNMPTVRVNERLANKILEPIGKTIKQIAYEVESTGVSPTVNIDQSFSFAGNYKFDDAKANNVIAIIEGRDLKDEYVVLSAHHDHEGMRYNNIYNGADDNASGVSSVLEIANILAKAKKEGKGPRRSVVILLPTAEEKGLIGSKYYVDNPLYPLNKTVACLNLDMLGRVSSDYESKGNGYVYVVNHKTMSGALVQTLERANTSSLNLSLDYKHTMPGDSERIFNRSDQYNFAEKGIPSIMLTSGEHRDYHKTTDDVELIDFDGLYKRTKLAFLLLWNIANSTDKLTSDIK